MDNRAGRRGTFLEAVMVAALTACLVTVTIVSRSALAAESAAHNAEAGVTIPITLGTKTIRAVPADTERARIQGLLGWDTIDYDSGMLLDFKMEGTYAIHMQGMKFPIDALWIDENNVIQIIYPSIPPDSGRIYPAFIPARYCLELKAGFCAKFGVKIGDTIVFGEGPAR